jgi:hypothetical protein
MPSCHMRNLRVLLTTVCGLLMAIVLGLGIWRIVIRIQRGNVTLLCLTRRERERGAEREGTEPLSLPPHAPVLESTLSRIRVVTTRPFMKYKTRAN